MDVTERPCTGGGSAGKVGLVNSGGFAVAVLVVFIATAAFSLSFALPYQWSGINTRWGIVIGAAAAFTWPFFIVLFSTVAQLSFFQSLEICVRTMVAGNVMLLASVAVNIAGWLIVWTPPFIIHMAVIAAANVVMFGRFRNLTRKHLGLPKALGLWFIGLNGMFALLVIIAYRFTIS